MIDINLIREKQGFVKKNLTRRKDEKVMKQFEELLKVDIKWRKQQYQLQKLIHKKNAASLAINKLKKEGKNFKTKIKEVKEVSKKLESKRKTVGELRFEIRKILMRLPNIMHDSVPYGNNDKDNKEIRKNGKKPKLDFTLKSHVEVAERLGLADFDKSSKISGSGFYFLKGDLALLNQALMRFAIDKLTKKGFLLIDPPLMMKKKAYEGVTDVEDFKNVMYKIEGEDNYLIATSEHPMCAMHMNEVIPENKLPLKYVGFSVNFRKEIGSHSIDEKGLYRRHQFWKVEQVVLCKPEESWKIHEELVKNMEEVYKELGLAYRIVNICTGDLGIVAAKKYDLEAWMPRTNDYKELGSGSNCTDYQARRLNIKCGKQGGVRRTLHTLNCTVAVTRALVAILENFQNKDGTVDIPKGLWPYMNGVKKLKKLEQKD